MPKPSLCNIFTHFLLMSSAKGSSDGKRMANSVCCQPPFSFLDSDGVVLERL